MSEWDGAGTWTPFPEAHLPSPQGMLLDDGPSGAENVAVVYDRGQIPPQITVKEVSSHVHQVLADGIAVAVIARATGPAPSADDVMLVERVI